MKLPKWFQGKSHTFGISSFQGDELALIFLKGKAGRYQLLGREVLIKGADPVSEEEVNRFRSRLETYRSQSPIWIDLVPRSAALVKVFSLPNVPAEELENALAERIQAEVPYLSEDVVLRHKVQGGKAAGFLEVLLYGISKAVLTDQVKKLESYGIVPDQVMLSTDVLSAYWRTEIFPSRPAGGSAVLFYWFNHHVELLFFEGSKLIQSHWISAGPGEISKTAESVQASFALFQREWHRKPQIAFLLGTVPEDASALLPDPAVKVEQIAMGRDPGTSLPPLPAAAARFYQSSGVFDFTLSELKEARDSRRGGSKRSRLAASIACFSLSIFLLGFLQAAMISGRVGWLSFQTARLGKSVKELKEARARALATQDFTKKKSQPILLLGSLRRAIPDRLFLKELEYREGETKLAIRGIAPDQSQVDQFVASLEREALFERAAIQTVQAERDEQGTTAYHFSIEGSLKT